MIFVSVAAGPDRLHRVASGRAWIVFDDGPMHVLPTMGMFARLAVNADGERLAVAKGHEGELGGQCLVVNPRGEWLALSPTIGKQCVGIEPLHDGAFRVGAIIDATHWGVWTVTADLDVLSSHVFEDARAAMQDWTDFRDGSPTWFPIQPYVVINGVRLWAPMTRGQWTVGLSDRADGVDAYDHAAGRVVRVWDGSTPYQPSLAAMPDGRAVVAISADLPAFVGSVDFRADWTVPVAVPVFARTEQPIAIGVFDEPDGYELSAVGWPVGPKSVGVFLDLTHEPSISRPRVTWRRVWVCRCARTPIAPRTAWCRLTERGRSYKPIARRAKPSAPTPRAWSRTSPASGSPSISVSAPTRAYAATGRTRCQNKRCSTQWPRRGGWRVSTAWGRSGSLPMRAAMGCRRIQAFARRSVPCARRCPTGETSRRATRFHSPTTTRIHPFTRRHRRQARTRS